MHANFVRPFTTLNKYQEHGTMHSRDFLVHYRFVNSKSNTPLFIYNQGSFLTYFLVNVNNLSLKGNVNLFI